MKKRIRSKYASKDGFTLIETIIALAIFSLLMVVLVTIFSAAFNTYSAAHTIDKNTDKQAAAIEVGEHDGMDISNQTYHYKFDDPINNFTLNAERFRAGTPDDRVHIDFFKIAP
ncbi:MAG: prepilin-type N-terminal cleavage/methylation domain-containing protein [Clostridiales bacterium]|mgnify:CR=1 FL=1|nr:prepilin-type N-terminal cleavage/methylation domain-containing protein [Clostridiales bacterium]